MQWNDHKYMRGKHAIFTCSNPCWAHYNAERAVDYVEKQMAKERGTALHEYAEQAIKLRQRQRGNCKDTICMYVNDALGYRLQPEVLLYYSDRFFGTADAIGYDEDNRFLRIHDLKTGSGPVHPEQLLAYAALFCLEYHKNPYDIQCELRIYQNNDKFIFTPTSEEIKQMMDQIIMLDMATSTMDIGV